MNELSKLLKTKSIWTDLVNPSWRKYSKVVSEDNASMNGLSKHFWTKIFQNTFWGQKKNPPDKKFFKIDSEVKTSLNRWSKSLKHSKILSEVKKSNPSGQ